MNEINRDHLKRCYSDLYDRLEGRETHHELVLTNDFPNLWMEDRCMHSRYQPEVEASRWVESLIVTEEQDAISIIGLGLGYYLEPLLTKYPEKKFIIIEPDEDAFLAFLEVMDARTFLEDDNIVFIVGKDPNTVKILIDHYYHTGKIKKVFYTQLPFYERQYGDYIDEVYIQLKKMLQLSQANIATDVYFVDMWLNNVVSNIKYLPEHQNIICLKNLFKGLPCIIIAAGPSLDNQLPIIRTLYDKALLIAVGTAAGILDSHGIKPHVIMGLDGNITEANIFKALKNHDPLFLYAHMIHHEAISAYQGPKMWFTPSGEHRISKLTERLNLEVPEIISGGSIAHTALSLTNWLECDPIILVGQDLAYTNDKLYASGAVHESDGVDRSQYMLSEDIFGEPIYTKPAFLNFRNWFEDFIALKMENKNIYNCTEGGLNIRGARNRNFMEIIEKYCTESIDIDVKIRGALGEVSLISTEVFKEEIEELRHSLDQCKVLSRKRVKRLKDLLEKRQYENDNYQKKFDQIIKLTDEMDKNPFYQIFLENTGQISQTAINRTIHHEAELVEDVVEKRRILLYGLYRIYSEVDRYIEISIEALKRH